MSGRGRLRAITPPLAGAEPGARRIVDPHRRHERRGLANAQPRRPRGGRPARRYAGTGSACGVFSTSRRSRDGLSNATARGVVEAATGVDDAPADGIVARASGIVCAVLTADCMPVLLCDRDATVVAAVHAGWRGIAAGIVEAGVRAAGSPPREADGLARTRDRSRALRGRPPTCATPFWPATPMRAAPSGPPARRPGGRPISNGSSGGASRGAGSAPSTEGAFARQAIPNDSSPTGATE